MKTVRRLAAVVVTTACAAAFHAMPALAAPVNAPGVQEFTVTCPGGDVVVVVPPNDSPFTPGFTVGTHELFVPYSVMFELTDDEGNVLFNETVAKKKPVPDDAVTCRLTDSFIENGEEITFSLTVVGKFVGKP